MTNLIVESFSWMTDAFKVTDIGPNTVRIKGVALRSNIVSKNNRKYVEDEVTKSGRTLINKPFTVNHNNSNIIGHVDWAEPENGVLEYLATVKKQPYVNFIRNQDPRIKGVSVDADYLHAQCIHCKERFLNLDAFSTHMVEVHGIRNFQVEPHQILFKALSLVVDPGVPGVSGTTVELAETLKNKGFLQLAEMLIREKKEILNKMSKANISIQPQARIAIGRSEKPFKMKEQDDPPKTCPEGQHLDAETGECVPDEPAKAEEQEACPEGQHRDAETGECVPDESSTVEEQEEDPLQCPEGSHLDAELGICVPDEEASVATEIKTKIFEKLALGEPFANYDSFADCVSKNADKEDPEAYCAGIMRKAEGGETAPDKYALETYKLEQKRTFDKTVGDIRVLKHAVREYAKDISTMKKALVNISKTQVLIGNAVTNVGNNVNGLTEQINTSLSTMEKMQKKKHLLTNASLNNLVKQIKTVEARKPFDPSPINVEIVSQKETIVNLEKELKETKEAYETILGGIDVKYKEYKVNMEKKLEEMTTAKQEEDEKIIKETAEKTNLTNERLDNVEAKLQTLSKFKGNVEEKKEDLNFAVPKHPLRGN